MVGGILSKWEIDESGFPERDSMRSTWLFSERLFIRSFQSLAGIHGLVNWLTNPCQLTTNNGKTNEKTNERWSTNVDG